MPNFRPPEIAESCCQVHRALVKWYLMFPRRSTFAKENRADKISRRSFIMQRCQTGIKVNNHKYANNKTCQFICDYHQNMIIYAGKLEKETNQEKIKRLKQLSFKILLLLLHCFNTPLK